MTKPLLAALVFLSASSVRGGPVQQPSQQDLVRAAAGAVNRPLVYHVDGEDKVRVRKDVVYRSDPEGKADIYEPATAATGAKTPIVVLTFMKPEQLALFSPAAQVEAHAATMPPMFVMRAGRDQIPGLNSWMETFLKVAIERNAPITLMIHPMGAHGFENTTDDDRSREIIRAAIGFMREQLR